MTIQNGVTGYRQTTISGADGTYRLSNIPPNPYHLEVTAPGFEPFARDVAVRNAIPVQLKASLGADRVEDHGRLWRRPVRTCWR